MIDIPETYNGIIGDSIDFLGKNDIHRLIDEKEPYTGLLGVPCTFLAYYDVEDYDIVDFKDNLFVNGKKKFARIIIRKRIFESTDFACRHS